jgi:hypothetical protein
MSAMPVTDENLKTIGKLGGVLSLILLAYVLATMVITLGLGGPPTTAQGIFTMLAENRFVGLLRLDVLTTLAMPLYYLLFFSLYAALKPTNKQLALIGALLGGAGLTLFLASPSFLSWLALSDKFAAATSEGQKNLFLAAGETILVADMFHGSAAFVGGLLLQTGTVLFSVMMLRSTAFSKLTAWVGIVTHGLDLSHIVFLLILPAVGVAMLIVGGTLYLVWFPLLARDFFRLTKG